jgi:hypothetical protein
MMNAVAEPLIQNETLTVTYDKDIDELVRKGEDDLGFPFKQMLFFMCLRRRGENRYTYCCRGKAHGATLHRMVLVFLFLIPFVYNAGVSAYSMWAPASFPGYHVRFVRCTTDFDAATNTTNIEWNSPVDFSICTRCNNNSDMVPLDSVSPTFLDRRFITLQVALYYNIVGGLAFTLAYLQDEFTTAVFTKLLAFGVYVKPMELTLKNIFCCFCCDNPVTRKQWISWRVTYLVALPGLTLLLGAVNFATQYNSTAWSRNVIVTKRTNGCPIPMYANLYVVISDEYDLSQSVWDLCQLFLTAVLGYAPHVLTLVSEWSDPYAKLAFTETMETDLGRKLDRHLKYQVDIMLLMQALRGMMKRLLKGNEFKPTCFDKLSRFPPFLKKNHFGFDKKEKYVADLLMECRKRAGNDPELFGPWRSSSEEAISSGREIVVDPTGL